MKGVWLSDIKPLSGAWHNKAWQSWQWHQRYQHDRLDICAVYVSEQQATGMKIGQKNAQQALSAAAAKASDRGVRKKRRSGKMDQVEYGYWR